MPKEDHQRNLEPNRDELIKVVNEMVQVQADENELRKQSLEIEQKSIDANKEVALASISSQKDDREKQFNLISKLKTQEHVLIGISIIGILVIVAYALATKNTEFAKEVLKTIVLIAGGYFAGLSRSNSNQSSNKEDKKE